MIECQNCNTSFIYKSSSDNKFRLNTKKIIFSEDLKKAWAICSQCKHDVRIPLSLGKSITEDLLYIPPDS